MFNKSNIPRSIPEEQGIPSTAILAFVEAVEKSVQEMHSFMILRHGHVIAEGWWSPYGSSWPHMLFSLSKSFTSTAVGFTVTEGYLSVDDPVISFFPQDIPEEIGEHLASMRVRHLLSMSTGHAMDTTESVRGQKDINWVKKFLSIPVDYPPGTHFIYNSGATYMLSAIVQKVTGQTLLEYLQPRLFEPLGIQGARWDTCPRGINTGGWGLSIKTEDIARFGQLYLQEGIWNGKRILSREWVEEATACHISNGNNPNSDWTQGYGYQFWRCRHRAYRGDGAFGQFCVIMPEKDTVVAITGGYGDMQTVLNLVWDHLLPVMTSVPLPHDDIVQEKLNRKLSRLVLLPPDIQPHSSVVFKISGRHYEMEENQYKIRTVAFTFEGDTCILRLWDSEREHRIVCGIGRWHEGETTLSTNPFMKNPLRIAASCTWSNEHTFVMTWRFVETPFYNTVTCYFEEEHICMESSVNVSFGPKELGSIQGRMM